jgi:CheY-like chemotaxis protein
MPLSPLALLDRVIHGRGPVATLAVPALPLQGLTCLAVEDSRFASDALRLMCQRSGARLRRVDSLHAAYAHLRVYRPDVMLIDMGLPDGRGDVLIRDLAQHRPQGPVLIAISGDPGTQADAMLAGAQGFMAKPFPNLAAFQQALLDHLPDRLDRSAPGLAVPDMRADPLALYDDLAHAAEMIKANPTPARRRYIAGFVTGLAQSSGDAALAAAATAMADPDARTGHLQSLLAARLTKGSDAFKTPLP